MAIRTSVSVQDNMSAAFMNMTNAINVCLGSFTYLQEAAGAGFDASQIASVESAINDMNVAAAQFSESINDAGNEQQQLNNQMQQGSKHASELGNLISKAARAFVGMMSINKISGFVSESMKLYDTQLNAERQLQTVLANMMEDDYVAEFMIETQVSADTSEAISKINEIGTEVNPVIITVEARTEALQEEFDEITQKASEIQSRGIYGDEAMIAGAAELSTYFTDPEAVEMMMDTLANYAMGMSGGTELDATAMTDYATGLGKVMTGAYDAMTKKGFEFSDAQKAVIEGTATEEQIIASLGEEYLNMSGDMQAAAAITQVIDEAWAGLYESMSNTPRGQIIQMNNAWGDMKEVVGEQLYPYVLLFVNTINDNWQMIETIINGFVGGLQTVFILLNYLFEGAVSVGAAFIDNWSIIEPLIIGAAIALGAYNSALIIGKGIQAGHAIVTGIHALATTAWSCATFMATVRQEGLNAALAACPITWIIVLIIALIAALYAGTAAFNKFTGESVSATGLIGGAVAALGAHIINTFVVPLWNGFASVANFIGNVFNDPASALKVLFYDLALTVIGYIVNIAQAIESVINKIPGMQVDITSGLDNFYASLEAAQQKVKDESGWVEYVSKMEYVSYESAAQAGYNVGAGLEDKVSNFFGGFNIEDTFNDNSDYMNALGDIGEYTGNTASGVGDIADSMEITEENLAWMKDIAEREVIDRTVFRDIKVDLGGVNNTVNNMHDLDSIPDYIGNVIAEQMAAGAEGVHS